MPYALLTPLKQTIQTLRTTLLNPSKKCFVSLLFLAPLRFGSMVLLMYPLDYCRLREQENKLRTMSMKPLLNENNVRKRLVWVLIKLILSGSEIELILTASLNKFGECFQWHSRKNELKTDVNDCC